MTRKQYYTQIYIYKKRRASAKKKQQKYAAICLGLSKKIASWIYRIKKIDERNTKLPDLVKKVNEFFNVKIESRRMSVKYNMARGVYYKMALEMDLGRGSNASEFIGRGKWAAGKGRKSFTKSFTSKPENKEAFYGFKNWFTNELLRA